MVIPKVSARTTIDFHLPANPYGKPGLLHVVQVTENADGSWEVSVFYNKYQCQNCLGWFNWLDLYTDEQLCEQCALVEASRHLCEMTSWHDKSRAATTVRSGVWLCEDCADRWDDANSYS